MNLFGALEIISTITGIACVFLQTREKVSAWPFGIVSVALAAIIFHDQKLYSDLLLHVFYFMLNIYGWVQWSKRTSPSNRAPALQITRLRSRDWLLVIGGITIGSIFWGRAVSDLTDASLPYHDSFTTVGSLVAQYLLARKVLDNWLIWIVVDIVAIYVYWTKGLYYFTFLFSVYLLLCMMGFLQWRGQYAAMPGSGRS